jgi:hypothetical protein
LHTYFIANNGMTNGVKLRDRIDIILLSFNCAEDDPPLRVIHRRILKEVIEKHLRKQMAEMSTK